MSIVRRGRHFNAVIKRDKRTIKIKFKQTYRIWRIELFGNIAKVRFHIAQERKFLRNRREILDFTLTSLLETPAEVLSRCLFAIYPLMDFRYVTSHCRSFVFHSFTFRFRASSKNVEGSHAPLTAYKSSSLNKPSHFLERTAQRDPPSV